MAEAVVDRPPKSRFFCHICSVEIERLLPEYTCPYCLLGFIEQLERDGGGGGIEDDSQGDQRSCPHGSNMEIGGENFSDTDLDVEPRPNDDFIRMYLDFPQDIRDTAGRVNGTHRQRSRGPQPFAPDQRHERIELNATDAARVLLGRPRRHIQPVEHLIQNFMVNLSGLGLNYMPNAQGGHQPVLFLGNPGDYVWGRDGLDTIVTQLLNQMDGSGPPPLPRKQIDEIPTAPVSQSQIDIKLQCSICWEDFILAELVRQLPCKHVYHTPCIEPWLELHGTCPICRQSLGDQTSADANRDTVGPSLAALFRAANQSTNSRTASSASSSSASTSDE